MVDSSAEELLNTLQTNITNLYNNVSKQKIKGVIINDHVLEVRLIYMPSSDEWTVIIRHAIMGIGVSDTYSTYALALETYNDIVST